MEGVLEKLKIAVIGGGPAGLFTAINIDKSCEIVLFEKNDISGRKLLMAGSGMCNFTHSGNISEFYDKYGDEKKFLRPSFSNCSNQDIINFFKENGIESEEDKNGKVFPVSRKSKEIADKLIELSKKNGVKFRYNESVIEIKEENSKFKITTSKTEYSFDIVVITTGGKSYPTTGSSGDGYKFAMQFGHTIIEPKSALAAVKIQNFDFMEIAGLSFQMIKVALFKENKKLKEWNGDILITNKGLSGPAILDNSRYMEAGNCLKVNFSFESDEKVRDDFLSLVKNEGKSGLKKFMKRYPISENMIKIILEGIGGISDKKIAEVSKEERENLIKKLTAYPFIIESVDGFSSAMATKGGISLKEINPKTMESKLKTGLYFAGEVIDIDGDTGGYNIQAAFSTGYTAAIGINSKIREEKKI